MGGIFPPPALTLKPAERHKLPQWGSGHKCIFGEFLVVKMVPVATIFTIFVYESVKIVAEAKWYPGKMIL